MHGCIVVSSAVSCPRALGFPIASIAMQKAFAQTLPREGVVKRIDELAATLQRNVEAICMANPELVRAEKPNQSEIARRATKAGEPLDQSTVQRVLKNPRDAKLSTLSALATGLGVPAYWLLLDHLNPAEEPFVLSYAAIQRAFSSGAKHAEKEPDGIPSSPPNRKGTRKAKSKPVAAKRQKTPKRGK